MWFGGLGISVYKMGFLLLNFLIYVKPEANAVIVVLSIFVSFFLANLNLVSPFMDIIILNLDHFLKNPFTYQILSSTQVRSSFYGYILLNW